MGRNRVAVLDIRSFEVAVFFGERGVNNTFVLNAISTEPYEGYREGKFFNVQSLTDAVSRAISVVEQTCGTRLRTLYVGVPGEFVKVVPKEKHTGFQKKRRIGEKEIEALFESGKSKEPDYRFIRATSMIYTTTDRRRIVDPTGIVSEGLSGRLSYFYCSEYFASTVEKMFKGSKVELFFLPTQFAMASYLIPPETRDEYALFLDAGFLSSSVLVLLGGGVIAQRSFWWGRGQIADNVASRLDIPYEGALALLGKANLFVKKDAGSFEFVFRNETYDISVADLVEAVKEGLDGMCEYIYAILERCSGKDFDNKPLYVSGEGLWDIRGAHEYMSKRISRICEPIAPDLPYYDKPDMSSRIALLDMACADNRKRGIFYKLLNGFGG